MKRVSFPKYLFLAAVLLSLTCLSCDNDAVPGAVPEVKKTVGVIIQDGTALRVDPIVYSSRILLFNRAETVEIIEKSKEKSSAGSMTDYWYKVRNNSGINGWIFGPNLKIFANKSKSAIDNFITGFWEEESKKIKAKLAGKWWSVDLRGDFTNHGIEISDDGTYKSYIRGGQEITGDYNINFNDNEVMFIKGTSFNGNLNIIKRGNIYFLEKTIGKTEMKFKKISDTVESSLNKKEEPANSEKSGQNQ
jgi:hypothetical protein